MGDLNAVTAADVAAVSVIEQFTAPAAAAIAAGCAVGIDAAGKVVKADADTGPINTKGISITSAGVAGQAITVVRQGVLDVGDVLDALAFGASVYSSGTAGLLADAAVGGLAAIGEVVPGWGYTTADKLLRVDC